jgi:hypothetical protein
MAGEGRENVAAISALQDGDAKLVKHLAMPEATTEQAHSGEGHA